MTVRECTSHDDYRHRSEGGSRTICGRIAQSHRPLEGLPWCPICFDPEPGTGLHPLDPIWELCQRLDTAANNATRPHEIIPDPDPRLRRQTRIRW